MLRALATQQLRSSCLSPTTRHLLHGTLLRGSLLPGAVQARTRRRGARCVPPHRENGWILHRVRDASLASCWLVDEHGAHDGSCSGAVSTALLGAGVVKVLAVREPYKYWQSLFKYSWLESSQSFVAWWLSEHGERSKALRRQGTLQTFAHFMRWVEAEGEAMTGGLSQSGRLHRACGEPCQFDRVLHTE